MRVLKIDVTKLDKAHFFKGKPNKEGHSPVYADLIIHENKDGVDKYGNCCFVAQGVSKEARDRKERGPIVGNGRDVGGGNSRPTPAPRQPQPPQPPDEDVPF